ncbi:uncharacterized protein LY89DRAFT_199712 [Mollisia scopiformis]|uniref:CENP-V/GFA domain-containing protein n=1 Tax=Mollisia scopiformis TaxID=149040 RepID=A0A194WYK4_MOLSC|nr:uncharacterized protein LY89DRAFT_199712 [Mollisia scopiformis]KUJ13046.1 hypothetical protein LY89DRAFT_199712 [Mollisia scopiformis]
MESQRPLQGGCSCGRNRYIIRIPQGTAEVPQVFFDNTRSHRRSQATPLSAWLRVPLSWYHSTTYAFMEDEIPSAIRRTYTSPHEEHCKRHFCGFCGTPLSYWSESPASEAEYISLTLGSLAGSDLRDLEDLGLLPKEALDDAENDKEKIENVVPYAGNDIEGLPWFETMVQGSRLGNMKKSWGSRHSDNGRFKVEWEIVEWTEGDEDLATPSKRKFGEVAEPDSHMEEAH